jgi:hypothetical protein
MLAAAAPDPVAPGHPLLRGMIAKQQTCMLCSNAVLFDFFDTLVAGCPTNKVVSCADDKRAVLRLCRLATTAALCIPLGKTTMHQTAHSTSLLWRNAWVQAV